MSAINLLKNSLFNLFTVSHGTRTLTPATLWSARPLLISLRQFSVSRRDDMRLVQFEVNGERKVGCLQDAKVLDLNAADGSLPNTMVQVLRQGLIEKCRELSTSAKATVRPLDAVKLMAPITGGDKVIGVGLNYRGHCEEQKLTIPVEPMFFSKFPSCIIGPTDTIQLREHLTKSVDWEVELAVIIGKEARDVSREKALEYVAGYCVAQDISARDWQKKRNGGQFLLGKSMDTFCPLGPCLVLREEVPDPHKLAVQCAVNGEQKQAGNTEELICRIDDIIQRLSALFTLLPGDVILTGTPAGVGAFRTPPQFLRPGQLLTSSIEGLGEIRNPIEEYKPQ